MNIEEALYNRCVCIKAKHNCRSNNMAWWHTKGRLVQCVCVCKLVCVCYNNRNNIIEYQLPCNIHIYSKVLSYHPPLSYKVKFITFS